ncbi:putative regulator of cell autolysis [Eggerthella sp. CAG:368]|nr:putative regulator of cell autolysis [Eggerthella sp. CAG:368]
MFGPDKNFLVISVSGCLFTLFLIITIALMLDPDRIRARQSMSVLNLASATLQAMQGGFDNSSAQRVCEVLYSASDASAVAITNRESVMGYYGAGEEFLGAKGGSIRTVATREVVEHGVTRVLKTQEEVGLPKPVKGIRAAIIVPLRISDEVQGTLKFYYPNPSRITETQVSIAEGFAQLISTQIAAMELEDQKKLATSMELKALQSQINPHFLFNIINTMASLVRTDPEKARVMLREFAVFYRQTLENSSDLISLSREVEQTVRYLSLEQARFGEDRLSINAEVDDDVRALMVPAFMIQPLVENSVKHAMPAEGKLTISISGEIIGTDVYLYVADDGIGMTENALNNIMNPDSHTGLGIAVKNINDRLRGYYGPESYMDIKSELGKGTDVTLFLKDCASV